MMAVRSSEMRAILSSLIVALWGFVLRYIIEMCAHFIVLILHKIEDKHGCGPPEIPIVT
jgi:hypothetical protein